MKRRWIAGLVLAALCLGIGGCGAQVQPVPGDDSRARRQVVDQAVQTEYAFAQESPAIDAAVALPGAAEVVQTAAVSGSGEVRAVWISYLEMAHLLKGKSKAEFTASIGAAFDNIKSYGLNTAIVHVRPFGDALYDSDYFPWSYTITGTEGKDPGYDPLSVMVEEAKARGLRIEAWLNPYRVRAKDNNNALSSGNPAKKWLDAGNSAVRNYGGVISYNPASQSARDLIVKGAAEIVRKYDVDGIHIDDYFYPTTDAAFDQGSYNAYKNGGGALSLADWRRSNVEKLMKEMYDAIKAENKNVRFGISPQSSVYNNYHAQYLDVQKIIDKGYCDYICPQIYFGYKNDAQPYQKTLDMWSDMVAGSGVKLYVGLAVYKVGITDSWAGSGKNEWTGNSDLIKRMVSDARSADNYGNGFVLYRYDSVFRPEAAVKERVQAENKNLKSIL